MKVDLLVTCLTDTFRPRAAEACVRLLEHLGCELGFPPEQTCCGQPLFNAGHEDEARDLARRTAEVFRESERVVTPSASCCAMIREHYPRLCPGEASVLAFVAKTQEFSEFLIDGLGLDPEEFAGRLQLTPRRFTWHDSCHLRALGSTGDRALRFLLPVAELDYAPLPNRETCCGFGGVFAVDFPEISGAMLADKVTGVQETGARILVCNDAGCGLNLAGGLHRAGIRIRQRHLAELLC
ncbi:MAG: (Fe-S)-binding protein, partial [Planctomycetes bacterium]|nr:(Fe-S)-binding protein [Planctomycetota bacterium]